MPSVEYVCVGEEKGSARSGDRKDGLAEEGEC